MMACKPGIHLHLLPLYIAGNLVSRQATCLQRIFSLSYTRTPPHRLHTPTNNNWLYLNFTFPPSTSTPITTGTLHFWVSKLSSQRVKATSSKLAYTTVTCSIISTLPSQFSYWSCNMAALESLPAEILFDNFCLLPQDSRAKLALTSRKLNGPATAALYHTVYLWESVTVGRFNAQLNGKPTPRFPSVRITGSLILPYPLLLCFVSRTPTTPCILPKWGACSSSALKTPLEKN